MQAKAITPSEFANLSGVEYFAFEESFIMQNVRCIPMIVRFKLDLAGIKLTLAAWCRFSVAERTLLALQDCDKPEEIARYRAFLMQLIILRTGLQPVEFLPEAQPRWAVTAEVYDAVQRQASAYGWHISATQWQSLSQLQRFALLKLCRPGHENENFPIAMKEFKLVPEKHFPSTEKPLA